MIKQIENIVYNSCGLCFQITGVTFTLLLHIIQKNYTYKQWARLIKETLE